MLLAVDIGNSNTLFGIFSGRRIIAQVKFPSSSIGESSFSTKIKRTFKNKRIKLEDIKGIIISSVVPAYTPKLARGLKQIFKIKPVYVSPRLKLGIRLGYKNPHCLGQDRLANAAAAYKLYGGPVIIVDYGTAITICLVTKDGCYKGGIILPGIEMAACALTQKTALLPYVKALRKPGRLIGRDTGESILSGLVYGLNEMVDGLIRKIKKDLKVKAKVISTGGAAKFFFPYSKEIDKIDLGLTMKGLYLIYKMNIKS
jgi:type III pantothenate kinase